MSPYSIDGRSFDELLDSLNYLELLRGRCERYLSERQSALHRTRDLEFASERTFEFSTHLYDGLESRFPAICSIAETVIRIDDRQRNPYT